MVRRHDIQGTGASGVPALGHTLALPIRNH
jgi:hypothetical protein